MKKILYSFLAVLLVILFSYFFMFVKSSKIEDSDFISICKSELKSEIKIELATAFDYITNYDSELKMDTVFVEVYTTTVVNIFNSSRNIDLTLPLDSDIKFVNICNENYNIESLRKCSSTNKTVKEVLKALEK